MCRAPSVPERSSVSPLCPSPMLGAVSSSNGKRAIVVSAALHLGGSLMKQATLLLFVLGCAACGCATTARLSYHTTIRITPAKQAGRYDVAARVVRETVTERVSLLGSRRSRETDVFIAPTMTCEPGKQAACTVAGSDKADVMRLEAYIARADEPRTTTCFLTVRKGQRTVITTSVSVPPLSP